MFEELKRLNRRPRLFGHYTTNQLWNDPYISQKMLDFHLDENTELASRPKSFIDRSVDWMKSHFNIDSSSRICDFGCGPGLYTIRLAQSGADVTGIDFSERSVNYAREAAENKNLSVSYHYQNYLKFETSAKYNLITMIYYDFCVLSPEQRRMLLGIFNKCLENDGAILLDLLSLNHFDNTEETANYQFSPGDGFWSSGPYYEFSNIFKYDREKVILNKYTIIEKTRTREIFNWLQCYSLESIEKEFRESGLRIEEHYANVAGDPYKPDSTEIAVIAKKSRE